MDIAKTLKSLRVESGLTQTELASKLNVGQATIACYENGQREPHILNLLAYAEFFECTMDFLVGRTDDFGNPKTENQKEKTTLSKEELNLILKFRKLNKNDKLKLIGYIDCLITP